MRDDDEVPSVVHADDTIDGMDNAVANAYGGLPDRLYLIGRGGRIEFQGDLGPEGFRPEALAAAIDRLLTT